MNNKWMERAKQNLFIKSTDKRDFNKARNEWVYKGLEDNEYCEAECELCNHEEIRYEYTIQNKINKNIMIVGSQCIKKFTDDFKFDFYDTDGNLVNEKRLTHDKKEFFKRVLKNALDNLFKNSSNPFYISIAEKIKKDGKLTPNQLKYMHNFYASLEEMGKKAFNNVVKVTLSKQKDQEQLVQLSKIDLEFVAKFMTQQQKKKFNI